jgi:glycosyltransferase involved in cell wall biosynthesis
VREWLKSRRQDFDVVHAHSTLAGQLTRLLPHPHARTVYSPHGLAAVHHRRLAVRSVLSVSERVLTRRTTAFAAVSASEEADLRTITTTVPVIRLPHARPASRAIAPRSARTEVVSVGRVTYQKAPETVLDLPAQLDRAGTPAGCVWIGDGDTETKARLREHGWQVTGWVDSAEVLRRVASAAAMVHPARYEGFSLAIVEALSQGTPVVARRIPGNLEFEGVRTFTTTDEAVRLLSELLASDDAWADVSREAVHYIERAHGTEAQWRALGELYGEEVPS